MQKLKQNKRSVVRFGALLMMALAIGFAWGIGGQLLPGGGSHGQYVWAQSVAQPSIGAAGPGIYPVGVKNGCYATAAMAAGVAVVNATCAAQYLYCGAAGVGLTTPTALANAYSINCGVTATATSTAIPSVTSTATTAFISGGSTTTATTTLTPTITATATTAAQMRAVSAGALTGNVVIYAWPF